MGISKDNVTGLVLAVSSSIFIGSSFIVKKMGLKKSNTPGRSAGSSFLINLFLNSFNFDCPWIF
jgi:hypothetical protein